MKKSTNVVVTTVAAIGLSIACSREQENVGRVCVDGADHVVSADMCIQPQPLGTTPHFWYYHAAYANGRYPAVGTTVRAGGATTVPGRAAPVARGGFGGTASGRSASA